MTLMLSANAANAQAPPPSFNVTYVVHLDQKFTLYAGLPEGVYVGVNGSVSPRSTPTVVTLEVPFSFSDLFGLPPGANYTLQSEYVAGTEGTLVTVNIPGNQTAFSFVIEGNIGGTLSFFFKDIASISPIYASMNAPPYSANINTLVPISSVQVRSVAPSGSSQVVSIDGNPYLQINASTMALQQNGSGASVVYQSPLSDYYAFIAIAALAAAAIAIPTLVWKAKRSFGLVTGRLLPRFVTAFLGKALRRRGPRALLSAFVFVCISMIVLSTVFGPPPQPRAYLAATPATSNVLAPYIKDAGWSYLTTSQAVDGFERTSNFGTFSVAVIADYPPPIIESSPSQSGLSFVPKIIVLKQYVSSAYLAQLLAASAYNPVQSVLVLSNASQLTGALVGVGGRQNVFGLTISEGLYTRAEATVGALSLLLPFFALAFAASMLVEVGGTGLGGILEAVGYALMVYFMAEFALIVSTVMLGTPVNMHAAISNQETAIGLLGPFGGGTRPRQLAGTLGFVFGVVYNRKGLLSFDKYVFAALLAGSFFLLADPLATGNFAYDLLVAVTNWNAGLHGASSIYANLRYIIGLPLSLFQSYITTAYVASHGDELFFIAALPFALYPRVGRGTGTLLLLFAAVGCGIGFTRTADLIPMEIIASAPAGLLYGVALVPVFWTASRVETVLRARSPFR